MQQGLTFEEKKKLWRNDQLWKLMSLPIWIGVRHHTPAAVVHAQQVRAQHWGGGGLLPRAVYLAWRFGKEPCSLNSTRMPPSQSYRLNLFPFVIPISCREAPVLSKSNIPLIEKYCNRAIAWPLTRWRPHSPHICKVGKSIVIVMDCQKSGRD